jgi:hypothetical protein
MISHLKSTPGIGERGGGRAWDGVVGAVLWARQHRLWWVGSSSSSSSSSGSDMQQRTGKRAAIIEQKRAIRNGRRKGSCLMAEQLRAVD